ncbi:TetR/AcrR family transcriptional regulator [Caulobacter soli]|uniref:TetR/AcrR family transcriptional regulator n=1 Tax=Caulobacter soli TaxID=2708539 RepID=UPI0013E9CCFC|nr:TetR/AcrR family transcriptional regulator [Caulobacter soli]
MAGRKAKISATIWIETARLMLVEVGIGGVKIDRLANRLGVTRGGFYHNFKDRDELLDQLLEHWKHSCRFLPDDGPGANPTDAVEWLDRMILRLIESDGYDYQFDMAVREWARGDQRAAWAVERADRERLLKLQQLFEALGYDVEKAVIRARVFYYHQIGYYAIGVRQSVPERRQAAENYLEILCGAEALAAARRRTTSAKPRARASA